MDKTAYGIKVRYLRSLVDDNYVDNDDRDDVVGDDGDVGDEDHNDDFGDQNYYDDTK